VLASSVDGVGSKLKVASALDRHDTIGVDLVNHCVNDILTCGAEPLFFLDYIAMGKLIPERVETIVRGIAKACSDVGCSLIGGETAEMPGLYAGDDYDLVGFIVGGVEKDKIINGSTISAGDAIVGLAASGLHTNGYALVRKIFGTSRKALNTLYPELGRTLGEELLEPHRLYYHQLKPVLNLIKGMAHITGGGIISNVPRVLPPGVAARIDTSSWSTPPIFRLIQQRGKVDRDEMYRVFNMGIGMVVICSPENADRLISKLPEANVIGKVEKQRNKTRVVID
jgi:phosphoribosylformylglycinamidine cyclo-ligase